MKMRQYKLDNWTCLEDDRLEIVTLCGIRDKITGEWIVPYKYTAISPFSEGLSSVEKDGLWGFINREGEEVVPCIYDDAGDFHCGLAIVEKNHSWGYINSYGKTILPFVYEQGSASFYDGLATVVQRGERYVINLKGERIV